MNAPSPRPSAPASPVRGLRPVPIGLADTFGAAEGAVAAALDMMPGWFWQTGADHRFTWFCPRFPHYTGADPRHYLGRSRMDLVSGFGADLPHVAENIDAMQAGEPFRDFTYRHVFPSGRERWISTSAVPIRGLDGAFAGHCGTAFLLDSQVLRAEGIAAAERRLLERAGTLQRLVADRDAALRGAESLLREVVEGLDQGVLVTTGSAEEGGAVVHTNAKLPDMVGVDPDLVKNGRPVSGFVAALDAAGLHGRPGEERERIYWRIQSGTPTVMPVRSPSGRYLQVRRVPREGGGSVTSFTDVTLLSERTAALEAAQEKADAAMRAKRAFLARLGHEFRTPMNGLLGLGEVLRDTLDGPEAEMASMVHDAAQALHAIVEDVLAFKASQHDDLPPPEPFDLPALVHSIGALHGPVLRQKGVALSLPEFGGPAMRMGHPASLRQVLLKLTSNATDLVSSGAVTLGIEEEAPGEIVLSVADTGPGIEPNRLEAIWGAFEQADDAHDRPHDGIGLGLAIVARLAARMGGEASCDSTLGQGSVFRVRLPLPVAEGGGRSCDLPPDLWDRK